MILKKVTILNKEKLSLPVTVFLNITVRTHNEGLGKKFNEILKRYNNILEAYRVTDQRQIMF